MADEDCDPVEKLLKNSGLSVDDLLKRLQRLKEKDANNSETENSTATSEIRPTKIDNNQKLIQTNTNSGNTKDVSDKQNEKILQTEEDKVPSDSKDESEVHRTDTDNVENKIASPKPNEENSSNENDEIPSNSKQVSNVNEETGNSDIPVTTQISEDSNNSESQESNDIEPTTLKTPEDSTTFKTLDDSFKIDDELFDLQRAVKDQIDEFENSDEAIDSQVPSGHVTFNLPVLKTEEKSDSSVTSDGLRDYLMKQLSSLRTKKKVERYLPDLQQKASALNFTNLKKKPLNIGSELETSGGEKSQIGDNDQRIKTCNDVTHKIGDSETSNDEMKENEINSANDVNPGVVQEEFEMDESLFDSKNESDDLLVTTTNETGFVISEVYGGVEDQLLEEQKEDSKIKRNKFVDTLINNILNHEKSKLKVKNVSEINLGENDDDPSIVTFPSSSSCPKSQDKSPFISDSLDDFLNESSKLKISYAVPKLRAEEGLKENEKGELLQQLLSKTKSERHQGTRGISYNPVKAKTLAEKRRLMQTRAIVHSVQRPNYVLFNRKKLWVATRSNFDEMKCIANIVFKKPRPQVQVVPPVRAVKAKIVITRKPSLLDSINEEQVKYRPGPLSKKGSLLCGDDWITEVKNLPQVFLEVVPEIGKVISTKIRHLLPFETIITEERANFAVSVVRTKTKAAPKTFIFPVKYRNNQKKIIVRKRRPKLPPTPVPQKETSEEIARDIVEDLINYVEVKMIADDLIKDDEDISERDNELEPVHVQKKKKTATKRTKLNNELARLSCAIITVEPEDEAEDEDCGKPFCTLGCVCKSIACNQIVKAHCGKQKCMFECTCAPQKLKYLSSHTMNQLEDVAKRHLAKVEREFTQTVIHKGKDTILLGAGNRKKSRRACKVPKKYGDFVENYELPENIEQAQPLDLEIKLCSVDLERLDLDSLMPFCLAHYMYDCHCKGEAPVDYDYKSEILKSGLLVLKEEKPKVHREKPKPKPARLKPPVAPSIVIDEESEISGETPVGIDSCARIRPIFDEYLTRHKEAYYREKLRKWVSRQPSYLSRDKRRVVEVHHNEFLGPDNSDAKLSKSKPSKRKQSFEQIRIDNSPLKTRRLLKRISTGATRRQKPKTKYEPMFEGEIKVDLSDNREFSNLVGEESLEYLRLLPWKLMMKCFHNGEVFICCQENTESMLMIGKTNKFPKGFINIRHSLLKNNVSKWILENRPPPDKPAELLHVILKPSLIRFNCSDDFYVMSGFCLKNQRNSTKQLSSKALPSTSNKDQGRKRKASDKETMKDKSDSDDKDGENKTVFLPSSVKIPPERNLTCSHKTINDERKYLVLVNKRYPNVPFTSKDLKGMKCLNLQLPRALSVCRWMVINLKNEFSFLRFGLSNYSIQYSDLVDVVNMAANIGRTICLRNEEFCQHYKHMQYGIYCVPTNKNIVLLGPYYPQDNDSIDLLKYVDGVYITTAAAENRRNTDDDFFWIYEENPFDLMKDTPIIDISMSDDEDGNQAKRNKIESGTSSKSSSHLSRSLLIPQKTMRTRRTGTPTPESFKTMASITPALSKKGTKSDHTLSRTGSESPTISIIETPKTKSDDKDDGNTSNIETIEIDDDEEKKNDAEMKTVNLLCGARLIPLKVQQYPFAGSELGRHAILSKSVFCSPFVISNPKISANFYNKYIYSNIPDLGYLVGYQESSSSELDVLWPIEDGRYECYRFPNEQFAIKAIEHYLCLIYCSIEEDFKIQVTVSYTVEAIRKKMVSESLTGRHVCGSFGSSKIFNIPQHITEKYALDASKLTALATKQSEEVEQRLTHLIALYLMSPSDYQEELTVEDIVNWAVLECSKLKAVNESNVLMKSTLIRKKRKYANLIKQNISTLSSNNAEQELIELLPECTPEDSAPAAVIEIDSSEEDRDERKSVGYSLLNRTGQKRRAEVSLVSETEEDPLAELVPEATVVSNQLAPETSQPRYMVLNQQGEKKKVAQNFKQIRFIKTEPIFKTIPIKIVNSKSEPSATINSQLNVLTPSATSTIILNQSKEKVRDITPTINISSVSQIKIVNNPIDKTAPSTSKIMTTTLPQLVPVKPKMVISSKPVFKTIKGFPGTSVLKKPLDVPASGSKLRSTATPVNKLEAVKQLKEKLVELSRTPQDKPRQKPLFSKYKIVDGKVLVLKDFSSTKNGDKT